MLPLTVSKIPICAAAIGFKIPTEWVDILVLSTEQQQRQRHYHSLEGGEVNSFTNANSAGIRAPVATADVFFEKDDLHSSHSSDKQGKSQSNTNQQTTNETSNQTTS